MGRPAKWRTNVKSAIDEVCLAVRLYNDPAESRAFEGFIVHMHLGWLYLLHALFMMNGVDFRYWTNTSPKRLMKVDGEPKLWELERSVKERWSDPVEPVRANLEFFISLRNKIEHRPTRIQQSLALSLAGQCQAMLLNFEDEVTSQFGADLTLASRLRFPVFIGTFSEQGRETLKALQKKLPSDLKRFIATYHDSLSEEVQEDSRFSLQLRVSLSHAKPNQSDLAIKFERFDELSAEEREAVLSEQRLGRVVVRDRLRDVGNLEGYKPLEVVAEVNKRIEFTFHRGHHDAAWRKHGVRPSWNSDYLERTDERYCTYNSTFRSFIYTKAWVDKLVGQCSTREGFLNFIGREPPEFEVPRENPFVAREREQDID